MKVLTTMANVCCFQHFVKFGHQFDQDIGLRGCRLTGCGFKGYGFAGLRFHRIMVHRVVVPQGCGLAEHDLMGCGPRIQFQDVSFTIQRVNKKKVLKRFTSYHKNDWSQSQKSSQRSKQRAESFKMRYCTSLYLKYFQRYNEIQKIISFPIFAFL